MDPNTNIERQRAVAKRLIEIADNEDAPNEELQEQSELATELAELVQSLDQWITRGGFLPSAWATPR